MNKSTMKKYAKAIVNIGINLQKGQMVIINSSIRQSKFVAILTEQCYQKGAKYVDIQWQNDETSKLTYQYASEETLSEVPNWRIEKMKFFRDTLPAQIHISDENPDCMSDVDMNKIMRARMKSYPLIKPISDEMENKYQWVIIAMPSHDWAKKVFPNDKPNIAYKKLENAILAATRIQSCPTKQWKDHIKTLCQKADILNDYQFDRLVYKSSNGTNLKVGLVKNHKWISAQEETMTKKKISFTPNMPTEEVFTMPDYNRVDGIVYSTKPLSLSGKLVENFSVTFKDGKVIGVRAETGQDVLENMLSMDEGSKHLGEVALVPWDSPINQTNILFYNTLFDENATCHLAFGMAFKNNVKDFEKLSDEDWKKLPYNDSMNHVDFMIGSSDLSIVGITSDGEEISIFKNGTWSI